MVKSFKDYIILSLFTVFLTFLIWLPFLLKTNFYNLDFTQGFSSIYRNYDGLEYVSIAKTFYAPTIAELPHGKPSNYFPSHFPLYPAFIAVCAPLFGFLKSMLFVSILFTILSSFAFFKLVKDFKFSDHPLWLSIVFLLLPARWVVVHSVGSPEPVFIFFTILSLYCFLKFEDTKKYINLWLATFFIILTILTRPPGVLLVVAVIFYIHLKQKGFLSTFTIPFKYFPLLLTPLALTGVFYLFSLQLGDFFAYFHSGDNIHLNFPPFQVFNKNQYWVGDIWLEDIIYIFLLGFFGGLRLLKTAPVLGIFVLTYLTAASLVAHRDISRYCLVIFPFLIIAFEKVLNTKEFKVALAILSLGIYLYSQNFLIHNTSPISELGRFN